MIYQFDCFEINCHNKQLRISNQLVEADERVIGLLIELTKHYPEYCGKSTLLTTLWPDTIVSDWSISKLVSDTRNLLKKHGYDSEVIHTLHGRGYRLSTLLGDKIREVEDSKVSTSSLNSKPLKTSLSRFFKWPYLLTLIISISVFLAYFIESPGQLQKSEPANSIGRLLWVDDNPQNNLLEKEFLEQHNITVYQVKSTEEALTSLLLYEYNLVISDMGRNGEVLAGLNLLKSMRQRDDDTPFVLYTIVLTQAQQTLLDKYQGQGVAVESEKLYQLVLPYFKNQ